MNKENITKMKELIKQLKAADIAYYRDDNPFITDREYDKLMDELKTMEDRSGLILSGSPTQTVSGEILEELSSVRHTKPMLSADKTKSVEELVKFASDHAVIMSYKLDGLTLVLRYQEGKLKQAITRGREGIIGEDVTHTVKTFLNVPLCISVKEPLEVRGEGVISWANFKRINEGEASPYEHPRNLAAGSVRALNPSKAKQRYLEFLAFDLVTDFEINTKAEQLKFMEDVGFTVVPYCMLPDVNLETVETTISQFDPKQFAYPVDGLIMEYNNVEFGKSLGATGHHDNRLIALKWEDELYETTFIGVELATTRTGMVSITSLFEPISIDGATVSRAYLHNLDIFESFQFGVGDKIEVYKANMIIPQIAENATRSNTYQLPMTCPCCGEPLTVKTTTGGTRQLFCLNQDCTARLVQRFTHFCEKTRMNIEGLSDTTLEKFVAHGWIKDFGDLYKLDRFRKEIIQTEGFGNKSFERMQAAIERSRHCTLAKFIAGLGIPIIGRHAGWDLARYFKDSWESFEEAIKDNFDFTQLPDFGETMHNNIYTWYADTAEAKLWRPLLDVIEFIKTKEPKTTDIKTLSNPFVGKVVVVTGKLLHYTRQEIQDKLLAIGAKPASSLTKKTDYLIAGEKPGSKLQKARDNSIAVLTEQQFESMLL